MKPTAPNSSHLRLSGPGLRAPSLVAQGALLLAFAGVLLLVLPVSAQADDRPLPLLHADPLDLQLSDNPVLTPTGWLPLVSSSMEFPVPSSTITLTTYGWQQALVPTTDPNIPYYPYPRLEFGRVGPPAPRAYEVIVLENDYVRVTVLPEIGGRILRWEDKTTGRLLTYANPVIKPSHWGYRGWWLATGGVEWAFPVEEHGLNEWRPWHSESVRQPGRQTVRVWDVDDRTGLEVEVTLMLYDDRSDLVIVPRISNQTGQARSFMFWINAMLTLSPDNRPSPSVRFWLPTDRVVVHSSGDETLPAPHGFMNWPLYGGRDFSRYSTWSNYLGVFAEQVRGVEGVYDETARQGLVRVYPPDVARGAKIFCLGNLGSYLYTDDNSAYFEMWGGPSRTFWPEDYLTLPNGATLTWEERWYPVHGMPGLDWANGQLAASLDVTETGVEVGLYAPAAAQAHLVLLQGDTQAAEWDVATGPQEPFQAVQAGNGTGWKLQIWQDGTLVATVGG